MTSKLKCPFCNNKLYQTASEPATYCCLYKDCQSDFKLAGSKELWQALIQAKQDLEIATKALEKYADEDMWETGHKWDVEYIQGLFLEHGYKIAKEALEQINRKQD